jgi:hypothetical protein
VILVLLAYLILALLHHMHVREEHATPRACYARYITTRLSVVIARMQIPPWRHRQVAASAIRTTTTLTRLTASPAQLAMLRVQRALEQQTQRV